MNTDERRRHSLSGAVDAEIISEEAAFCGLKPADIKRLADAGYGAARVQVRTRSAVADGRFPMTVRDVADWIAQPTIEYVQMTAAHQARFTYKHVRDIMAVSL